MSDSQLIRVLVAADFTPDLMDRLRNISDRLQIEQHFPDVPESAYEDAEVMYTIRHFPEPSQAPRLRWIQVHSAGLNNHLQRPIVQAEDVEVTSTSGIHAVQMSEYCLAMMLAFMYRIPQMLEFQKQAVWPKDAGEVFRPHALRGLTLGIAGYGSIGRELGRLAHTMGMKVLATKRDLKNLAEENAYAIPGTGDPEGEIPDRFYPPEALLSMAKECDFLVVTIPLTEKTRHSIGEAIFKAMKKSAVFINVGRGAVVDEDALISALAAEEIAGAGLDVFEEEPLPSTSPLWNLENVIISPHVAGNTIHYHHLAADLFAENLRRYLDNRPLLNRLDRSVGY